MVKYFGVLVLALFMPIAANATLILSPGDEILSGPETSQALINLAIAAALGTSTELYKQNVGDAFDTGSAAGWYTTTFTSSPSDPSDALIEWDGPGFISSATHLLVKDGNHSPAWYLFDISGWDGMEDISATGFWTGRGAISHVTLYGGPDEVPEPGPLGLLGAGMIALYLVRRRQSLK